MAYYDLNKNERAALAQTIEQELYDDLRTGASKKTIKYFSDADTYIRKAAYLAIGKIYKADAALLPAILDKLHRLFAEKDFKVRQTAINGAGEIGKTDFEPVAQYFDTGLFDAHHSVRNAVIGSVKKMGEKNPAPVLQWARKYLHHPNKEIRREICHGIELRGRTHPGDILPLLKELQFDKTARVSYTLVHVIGQISYKKNCLAKVMADIATWDNNELVHKAVAEIIAIHERYRNFSALTQNEAIAYIRTSFPELIEPMS